MNLKDSLLLKWYFHLYYFVARTRLFKNDIDVREIHTTLVVILTTGILMWGYGILALLTISSPVPGVVGLICALTHTLAPLIYRFSNNTYIVSNVLLLAGIIHQSTFSFYTGGFDSNILIWFGILPMIGGVSSGQKGAITWTVATSLISLLYFLLYISDFEFPNLITHHGHLWSQAFLVFGWIFLSSTIVIVYSGLRESTEKRLQEQSQKIDDLFRVLFHDLANPLGRVSIGLSIAQRSSDNSDSNRGFEIAKTATDSMIEITQNIRNMYAARKGKTDFELFLTSLNASVEYIKKIYAGDLERKNITLEYDPVLNQKVELLVEPVSFKNQVLGNIVSNAIKFSPEYSKISIKVIPRTNGYLALEVKDQGVGIPKHLIPQLFEVNKKTSRLGTMGEKGSGFGMNIMKSFLEMYNASIEIDSVEKDQGPDPGTTVRIILRGTLK